jgi:hypothetical protein
MIYFPALAFIFGKIKIEWIAAAVFFGPPLSILILSPSSLGTSHCVYHHLVMVVPWLYWGRGCFFGISQAGFTAHYSTQILLNPSS